MRTEADAVRMLAYAPQCTNAAVRKVAALADRGTDARLLSDLAAAYYIRAERNDDPTDFVRSLDASERAVRYAASAALPPRFNRALAAEALGLMPDATQWWDEVRRGAPNAWTAEAQMHYSELTRERARSAAVQWPLNQRRLPEAARRGDARAVRQLVSPYRDAAQRYVEEEVLPAWAAALRDGRGHEAAQQLNLATVIASALAGLTGNSYLLDSVRLLHSKDAGKVAELGRAHLRFAEARAEQHVPHWDKATTIYAGAEKSFARLGSPMHLGAMIGRANGLIIDSRFDPAFVLLRKVEREAVRKGYTSIVGLVHGSRGLARMIQGRYLDAIAEYAQAEAIFARMRDVENLSNALSRKTGMYRLIGHEESTWRQVFDALQYEQKLYDVQSRHVLLGECAASAVVLGYPAVGLHYQNMAVRLVEDGLAHSDDAQVAELRHNLGVALRARAAIRVRLNDNRGAQTDLDTAIPLIGQLKDPTESSIPAGLRARLAEVQAQTVAPNNRGGAIAKFGEAIREASNTHYRPFVASLLIQRAELYRLDGNRTAARADLQSAIAALRTEEQALMAGVPRVSGGEILWSAYFARFQPAYRQLIRYLIEDGSDAEAFAYAEKSRAFELLQRVRSRADAPPAFRDATDNGEPYSIAVLQQALPAGTYVLEYEVLDDRTYVWLIRRDGPSERFTLPARESDIAGWTTALQTLAAQRDVEGFEAALAAPYQGLLQDVVARIASFQHGVPARLVIVPDRAMHGLPFAALGQHKHYLVREHAVSVAASATLYAWALAQDRQLSHAALGTVLLFADPKFNRDLAVARGLPPLHQTEKEAARIRAVYAPVMHVEERKQQLATVPELLRMMRGSTITHIAAHGIANADAPSGSYLLLAPTENDSGALGADRLLTDLRLERTRLVVLSACSSVGGTPVGPEGIAPLVRPLIAAGVPGIVGTLWNIGENSATAEVLVRFHRHYKEGHDAADALRLAENEMLNDPDLERSSVLAWAPFQMVGYASSPFPLPVN
jgi:CHAT domain-containing protein